ncbi:ester cyclase [Mucilaginibacter sp.]|uniref:ester cyclase n=1 Tax=Mucilaginibacter sp. TaxID=1882438 RepID=UPI003567E0F5
MPDLQFKIDFIVASENQVASRLIFHCTPKAEFKGIPVNGRKVLFAEHVFYKLLDDKISEVSLLIDTDAIRAQISQ